jgi:hypothetical protein
MRRVYASATVAFLVLIYCTAALADSWPLPEPAKYYSSNKRFYIEVIPRKLESQLKFFDDKVKGVEPAGSPRGLKDNYCKGALYRQTADGKYEKVWESRLSNEVAPVAALVSDDGEHVVTFDNWHAVGFGDNVVAIYGAGGRLIKKLSLEDIFPRDAIIKLPRSVSSIYWRGEPHIDERRRQLVLKVVSQWSGAFKDEPQYKELRLDLGTGELIREERAAE